MDSPIILCGVGLVGWRVLHHLRAFGRPIVVIDNKASPDDPRLAGDSIRFVQGDCRQAHILREAGVENAFGVIIATSVDLVNLSTALTVRQINREVRLVVRMFNQSLITHLDRAVPNAIGLSVSGLAAPRMARLALTSDVLTTFENTEKGLEHVVTLTVSETSGLRGKPIGAACREYRLTPVAYQCGNADPKLLTELDPNDYLKIGDRLTVAAAPENIAHVRGAKPGSDAVRWAGKIVRHWRVVRRSLLEVDLPVKIVGAVLASVMLFSILIFRYVLHEPWTNSVYDTIALLLTEQSMGDAHFHNQPNAELGKLFVSFMKVMGVVLIAAFTAIITNFLIRARLDRALEARRIPEGGHVVVCGLGSVGYRIVEELLAAGIQAVVIEPSRESPFVDPCRRRGVPVILGDATVETTLRQAHVLKARAAITATSDNLTNLEIALMLNALHPGMPVVVRMNDPLLAEALREQAGVPQALSIPALAAPAFVAALFEDRVQSVFQVGNEELVVVDVNVDSGEDYLIGHPSHDLATMYNMLPVGLTGGDPNASRDTDTYTLRPGDRMTVFTTARDLGRLTLHKPN